MSTVRRHFIEAAIAVAFILLGALVGLGDNDEPANEGIELRLALNKTEVAPGETVRLEEVIVSETKGTIVTNFHKVLRVGEYSNKVSRLVNLDSGAFVRVSSDDDFDGLPACLRMPHGMGYTVRNPRQKGTEFEIRAKRLGVFLIVASWRVREPESLISSNPVVLVIKPPTDARGRPIIKPEWLKQ